MNAIKRSMPMQTCTVKVYECVFLTAVKASLNITMSSMSLIVLTHWKSIDKQW